MAERDPLDVLLRQAADRRSAGIARPPLPPPPVRSASRRLAPVLAVAAVLAVVAGASLVPRLLDRAPEVPAAPVLGTVVPPDLVARKLGAPAGHTAGDPVAEAQLLAVAPRQQGRPALQTVSVVRARADGPEKVDRCSYTYDDALAVVHGICGWSVPVEPYTSGDPVEVDLLGRPGSTWLEGTAPPGTRAVVLRAPGRDPLTVPVAAVGAPHGDRPRFVAWWPRTGTDVVALDAGGTELARGRVPSEVVRAPRDGDPQLGTLETPTDVRRRSAFTDLMAKDRGVAPEVVPDRVDVLARTEVRPGVVMWTLGYTTDRSRCTVGWLQDTTGEEPKAFGGGGGSGCSTGAAGKGVPPVPSGEGVPALSAGRSWVRGTGRPEEQTIDGTAPAGTVRVRLEDGRDTADLPGWDSGPRWDHRAWFLAAWKAARGTRVTAYDAAGRVLATTTSGDLDERRLSPRYYAADADCHRAAGYDVVETPQGSAGPSYAMTPPKGSTAAGNAAVDARCTAEAERAVGLR